MQITPNEIDSIEDTGTLNGSPVKMIRTKGGFFIAVGRGRGTQDEALAAGSHPAIVKYNLEKQYPGFQASMMKSEGMMDATVDKHSHHLTDELRKSGHDIYSVQTPVGIEFHLTKQNVTIKKVQGTIDGGALVVKGTNVGPEFSKSIASAAIEKATSCGAQKIRIEK